jgi:hypothetical protein
MACKIINNGIHIRMMILLPSRRIGIAGGKSATGTLTVVRTFSLN